MQRALGERRERADRLDLVAEELDPKRLAARGREDVEDAAADGELAALVGPLDPLVAGERELLGEPVDARLVAEREPQRRGPGLRRRRQLGERGRGGADEPARGQHVEGAGALADEVRRRLESRLPAHAAAGQQRDALLAEEPAGGLGRVARVGVVGEQADERPAELLPERRQHERQRRLGDASACRKRLRECVQPLVRCELADEGVEDRTVHDDGTRHASRPGRV